jgi:hypothetical protein
MVDQLWMWVVDLETRQLEGKGGGECNNSDQSTEPIDPAPPALITKV